MDQQLSILNIGGHPIDAIQYAGGTLAKHAARGDRVCNLTPTHGMSHHIAAIDEYASTGEPPDMDALIEQRGREFVEATNELGVTDARFLGYDDQITTPDKEIINDIADVIGDVRPDIIITHWPYDSVPAHANATQMTLLAMDAAGGIRPGKSYKPHTVAQLFYHTLPGRTNVLENLNTRIPTTLIDIGDVVDKKDRATGRFASQYRSAPRSDASKIALADLPAIHSRVRHAESFVAHNVQVHEFLPVTEFSLKVARMSGKEQAALLGL